MEEVHIQATLECEARLSAEHAYYHVLPLRVQSNKHALSSSVTDTSSQIGATHRTREY